MVTDKTTSAAKGTIQSAERAVDLLKTMTQAKGPLTLTELAHAVGMPAAKAHRYLSSLINTGLVTQTHRSGAYDLGDFAIQLGLSALSRQNLINRAADAMEDLVRTSQATALLAVWGTQGPTIIRWQRSENHVVTALGLGTTMPLLSSASGRIFVAYTPRSLTRRLVAKEQSQARRGRVAAQIPQSEKDLQTMIDLIRLQGYTTIDGGFIPGLSALAAPVLNIQGEVEASLTLIGTSAAQFEPGTIAFQCLLDVCAGLSQPQL
ncbi:MAG: IclR family transcriptional regulator [Fimbriimonadaceae bacterium]|nr:IclR family transcriptional regulator [Alphaproteobacteria bacterium]